MTDKLQDGEDVGEDISFREVLWAVSVVSGLFVMSFVFFGIFAPSPVSEKHVLFLFVFPIVWVLSWGKIVVEPLTRDGKK